MKFNTGNEYGGKKSNPQQKRDVEQMVYKSLIEEKFGHLPQYSGVIRGKNEETKQGSTDEN